MIKLGLPVVYRPRVPYGRQHELFGFVTRVIDPVGGVVDVITFPTNSEPVHINSVAMRSENVNIHCWSPIVDDEKEMLRMQVDDLTLRLNALEKRAGRKAEAA